MVYIHQDTYHRFVLIDYFLQLLLQDGAGYWAGSSDSLCNLIHKLLRNGAEQWKIVRSNMLARSYRVHGAAKIADILQERLSR